MKKLLSTLICLVMVVGIMPTAVSAWKAPTVSGGKAEWNVSLSDDGLLTWNDMGGTSYDIYVDKTEMGGTVTKILGVAGTSYNLINRFKELKIENGNYYFYIEATNTGATSGDMSFKYVSPEPKLSAPQNLYWDGTVANWDSVDGATEYNVRLYNDSGYLQLNKTTTATQYDWSTYAFDDYWFEVVATGDNFRDSNVSESPKYGNIVESDKYTVTYDANKTDVPALQKAFAKIGKPATTTKPCTGHEPGHEHSDACVHGHHEHHGHQH